MPRTSHPDTYYDAIKRKFAEERDLRLAYRPEGTQQFTSDFSGELAKYAVDPYRDEIKPREPIRDSVEVLFIGGGFSALLTSARLREKGVESIRIVERGADVGGTWYWNRYPGAACDVVSYDYLPLLDETGYVPKHHYSRAPEIFAYCQADRPPLQPVRAGRVPDHGDLDRVERIGADVAHRNGSRRFMRARFVICANGTLSKPKLSRIAGMEKLRGSFLPHLALGLRLHRREPSKNSKDKVVGIIGTGATAVQAVPDSARTRKNSTCFSARRRRSTFATTGRRIRNGPRS